MLGRGGKYSLADSNFAGGWSAIARDAGTLFTDRAFETALAMAQLFEMGSASVASHIPFYDAISPLGRLQKKPEDLARS